MTAVAKTWPYRRADRKRVRGGPWLLTRGDAKDAEIGEEVVDWDPTVDVRLRRAVVVDAGAIVSDCGLPEGTLLRVAAAWRASSTSVRGVGTCFEIEGSGRHELELFADLTGADLGGDLQLVVSVVLGEALAARPITAWRLGSVLWEDARSLRLEGGASRFPIEEIAFSASGVSFPDRAAWRLDWEPDDLELPVLGSVRLFVNNEHPTIRLLLDAPERPEARLVTAFMMFDVTRALLKGALAGDRFCGRDRPWPNDSVGKVVERIFKLQFRGASAVALREMVVQDPELFDAMLQDRLGLLRGR